MLPPASSLSLLPESFFPGKIGKSFSTDIYLTFGVDFFWLAFFPLENSKEHFLQIKSLDSPESNTSSLHFGHYRKTSLSAGLSPILTPWRLRISVSVLVLPPINADIFDSLNSSCLWDELSLAVFTCGEVVWLLPLLLISFMNSFFVLFAESWSFCVVSTNERRFPLF